MGPLLRIKEVVAYICRVIKFLFFLLSFPSELENDFFFLLEEQPYIINAWLPGYSTHPSYRKNYFLCTLSIFFTIINCVQSTWTILSNHLLQLLYSVPSPCMHCLAVTDEVGISMTLGDWVECGGGWSKQRRKIAFSTASRLALLWRSMNLRQWKCCHMR